jgi:hypothetical protein
MNCTTSTDLTEKLNGFCLDPSYGPGQRDGTCKEYKDPLPFWEGLFILLLDRFVLSPLPNKKRRNKGEANNRFCENERKE